jgi:threonyl-tRNA synthetase
LAQKIYSYTLSKESSSLVYPSLTAHFSLAVSLTSRDIAMASEGSKDLPVRPAAGAAGESFIMSPAKIAHAPPNRSIIPGADSLPDFILERNKFFEELWQQHLEELKNKPHPEIKVTIDLGNGNKEQVSAKSWETTPAQLLKNVPKELSANVVISKIDGKELWDLGRPLERDCTVSYVPFEDPEGREVFWHSSAHCLGEACECEYGCLLSHGPPTAQGFFYDMAMPEKCVTRIKKGLIWLGTDPVIVVSSKKPIGQHWISTQIVSSRRSRASTD